MNNLVFILEGLDDVGDADEQTDALLGVMGSSKPTAFTDAYLDVSLDLSGVLWLATATDAGALPAAVRDCARRRPAGVHRPREAGDCPGAPVGASVRRLPADVVTSALVPALLGDGSADPLPLAVRATIETERARLAAHSSSSSRTSP